MGMSTGVTYERTQAWRRHGGRRQNGRTHLDVRHHTPRYVARTRRVVERLDHRKNTVGVAEANHGTVALPEPAESPVFSPPEHKHCALASSNG